jgi:FKBP-type peptidyl-prolyl cis-trans isomerase FklB
MKIKGLVIIAITITVMLSSCAKNAIQSAKLKSQSDSLSYAFGTVYYNALTADSLFLEPIMFAKAMVDGKNSKAGMTDDVARSYIMVFINKREQEMAAKKTEDNKVLFKDYIAQNEEYLARNKEKAGVTVTPSGLQYEVITMGTGPKPTAESTVKVHYLGTLIDGSEFDSSYKRNSPAEFPVTGVISGWTEALQLMPVGSKFKIYLPANIAYGPNGAGEMIKPFSTLIFEIELLEITK